MRQYEVEQAYLFGSAAKGTMHESSDVDFIIRFPKNMHYTTYANNYFAPRFFEVLAQRTSK